MSTMASHPARCLWAQHIFRRLFCSSEFVCSKSLGSLRIIARLSDANVLRNTSSQTAPTMELYFLHAHATRIAARIYCWKAFFLRFDGMWLAESENIIVYIGTHMVIFVLGTDCARQYALGKLQQPSWIVWARVLAAAKLSIYLRQRSLHSLWSVAGSGCCRPQSGNAFRYKRNTWFLSLAHWTIGSNGTASTTKPTEVTEAVGVVARTARSSPLWLGAYTAYVSFIFNELCFVSIQTFVLCWLNHQHQPSSRAKLNHNVNCIEHAYGIVEQFGARNACMCPGWVYARTHVCESGCGCVNGIPHAAHQNIFYASHCSRYNNRWHIRAIFQQVLQSHITIIRARSFATPSSPSMCSALSCCYGSYRYCH